jgi:hypothetical protein
MRGGEERFKNCGMGGFSAHWVILPFSDESVKCKNAFFGGVNYLKAANAPSVFFNFFHFFSKTLMQTASFHHI